MHNTTKIRLFRPLLWLTWLPSLLFLYPLALFRRKLSGKHVFFFDRYSLGGAQRVHLDILNSIADLPKLVLFTRFSPDGVMKPEFDRVPNAVNEDIHFFCDNLLIRIFTVHYWAFFLNRHRDLVVFSSNSTFFYDLLPWLRKDFQRMELLHNFTYGKKGMEFFGLANYPYLDKRLVVDHATAENIRNQYQEHAVAAEYADRIQIIEPGVDIPGYAPQKAASPLTVLYAGRGGQQKRVWLIDRIAKHCYEQGWDVQFHFAGNPDEDLSAEVIARSVMHGQVQEKKQMQQIYAGTHVILMTSAYEGFPMFIKEGMAQACIPVVTALPGNRTHLHDHENALLIHQVENEGAVVDQGIHSIKALLEDFPLRERLSAATFLYASGHFSKSQFLADYRQLLCPRS